MHGTHTLITRLQGSLVIKEDVTIRIAEAGGNGDFALTAGWEFDSVDEFLNIWRLYVTAGTGNAYTFEVVETGAARGKVKITNTGNAVTISWAHAGSATEGARIRDFLGESADVAGQATPYTFGATHKAGFYPSRGATRVLQSTRKHFRQIATSVTGGTWAQCDVEPRRASIDLQTRSGGGAVSTEITLSLDGSTDWAELGELVQFVDDVFAYMGEPWTIYHLESGQTIAKAFTGYFTGTDALEIRAARIHGGWNGLLTVDLQQESRTGA